MVVIVILFSLITINNSIFSINSNSVSALSYSSSVGVGFTFNPTLSVNISPSDLVIPNLTPGTTDNSNIINVSVATNASYGYTLSAIMNGNNNDLTHTNRANTFSGVATDSSLPNLVADNTWGYSYKLSNNTAWNNYSGLSHETSKTLIDSNDQTVIPIDFKIAAKASNTQPSGTYTGTINFTAVSNVAPMSLLDSFIASGAEQLNGYYKMQDMTHDICEAVDIEESELQLIDVRDNKIYWVAKLKDGNCWMTQNLDFNIQKDEQGNPFPLTSETTDLIDGSLNGIYSDGYNYKSDPNNPDAPGEYKGLITWTPSNSTNKAYTLSLVTDWQPSSSEPYSYDIGENYPDSIVTKGIAGNHALSGNYYNWSAAVASSNTISAAANSIASNSVCPKKWKLPTPDNFKRLYSLYKNDSDTTAFGLTETPLWFIKAGFAQGNGVLSFSNTIGAYWSSVTFSVDTTQAVDLFLYKNSVQDSGHISKERGFSLRCISR